MKIYKYTLRILDRQVVRMPRKHKIMYIGNQRGALTMWAEVEEDAITEDVIFELIGTGMEFDVTDMSYLASVIIGPFVWHVYKKS